MYNVWPFFLLSRAEQFMSISQYFSVFMHLHWAILDIRNKRNGIEKAQKSKPLLGMSAMRQISYQCCLLIFASKWLRVSDDQWIAYRWCVQKLVDGPYVPFLAPIAYSKCIFVYCFFLSWLQIDHNLSSMLRNGISDFIHGHSTTSIYIYIRVHCTSMNKLQFNLCILIKLTCYYYTHIPYYMHNKSCQIRMQHLNWIENNWIMHAN